jgi:hypothetical protein
MASRTLFPDVTWVGDEIALRPPMRRPGRTPSAPPPSRAYFDAADVTRLETPACLVASRTRWGKTAVVGCGRLPVTPRDGLA